MLHRVGNRCRWLAARLGWMILYCGWIHAASGADIVDIRRDFQCRHWTMEEGLPDLRIHCLLQTRDGYLWLGTRLGLVRFDGVRFVTFNRANTPSLVENEIHALAEDSDGTLWINGKRQPLTLFRDGGFQRAVATAGPPIEGELLGASRQGGVWVCQSDTPAMERWQDGMLKETIPLRLGVGVAFKETLDAGLWIAEAGHLRFRPALGAVWQEFPVTQPTNALAAVNIFGQTGNPAWLYGSDSFHGGALRRLDGPAPGEIVQARPPTDSRSSVFVTARDGSLWLPLARVGLLNLRGERELRYGLPWGRRSEDHPLCALEDREGNLWVGSEYSGLFCLHRHAVATVPAGVNADANVRSVLAEASGRVWLGTDAGLLTISPEAPMRPTSLAGLPVGYAIDQAASSETPLSIGSVRALASDGAGGLWIGTSPGLQLLRSGQILPQGLPVLTHGTDPGGLGSRKPRGLCLTRSGCLWIATPHVLSVLPPGDAVPRPVSVFPFQPTHNAVLEDRAGNIWVATDGAGVGIFPATQIAEFLARPHRVAITNLLIHDLGANSTEFTPVSAFWLSTTNGLPSNHAWELYEARDGAMWIATEAGVARVRLETSNSKPETLFTFTTAHGLPEHQVNSLLEDDFGHVWFGTDTGIFRVSHDQLLAVAAGRTNRVYPVSYGEADGMLSAETNGRLSHPGACKTADGRLWFATTKGIAVLDPARLLAGSSVPPLAALETVLADGERIFGNAPVGDELRSVAFDVERGVHKAEPARPDSKPETSTSQLRLPPGRARVLEFRFTALHFTAPERCRFKFRLHGYDPAGTWHEAGDRRLAVYTNLDPGDYRFEVQVSTGQHVGSVQPAAFAFTLAPFLWQTWWFWTLVSLAAGGVLAGLVGWRLRWVRQISALENQNALLQQRTGIARDLHDDLGPRLTQLALLTELAESRAQGLEDTAAARQQLASIARDLSRTLEGTLGALEPQADTLPSFADVLGDFAHDFLSPTGVALHLDRSDGIPPHPLARTTKRQVFLIVKEALNNLVKHASASRAVLRMHHEAGRFTVEITDNGRGFEAAQLSATDSPLSASHSGLRNLRSRADAIRASLEIESSPGQGTTVRLTVPLNEHAG